MPLAVAAGTFLWRLGGSSLFVDETYSWLAAHASLGNVFSAVRETEVAPPSYYLLLHFWIALTGSDSVWTMRLLSVLAGLGVVAAVWWLARLVAGNAAAVLAGLTAAASPLLVEYAQEARAYVFVMLCATIAVAAAITAARTSTRQLRWLALAAVAAVATIWTHYTGLLVIGPVAVYVWCSPTLSRRARSAYVSACALALAAVAPLMVIQLRAGHQGGVAPFARLTTAHIEAVIATPFDGRFPGHALTLLLGAATVVVAVAYLAASRRRRSPELWLLLATAVVPVAAVVGVTVAATVLSEQTYDSLITRYTAVAAPFMLIALAWAIVRLARPVGVLLAAVAALAAVTGLLAAYSTESFWPDLGGAFAHLAHDYHAGDEIALAGTPAQYADADYYVAMLRHEHPAARVERVSATQSLPVGGTRLWVIADTGTAPAAAAELASAGWHETWSATFTPGIEALLAVR